MVAHMIDELARGPGCSDVCRLIYVIRPGLLGRQPLLVHDPETHEHYGVYLAGGFTASLPVETGLLVIDEHALIAWVDGQDLHLTSIEWKLLLHMARRLGRFSLYDQIVKDVWGANYLGFHGRHSLTVHNTRLRGKLGPRAAGLIETRTNLGYRLLDWPIGKDAPAVMPGMPRRGQR